MVYKVLMVILVFWGIDDSFLHTMYIPVELDA